MTALRRCAVTVALMIALGCTRKPAVPAFDPSKEWIGRPAPAIALKTLDGKDASLGDYRGKIVVLHFGTSW